MTSSGKISKSVSVAVIVVLASSIKNSVVVLTVFVIKKACLNEVSSNLTCFTFDFKIAKSSKLQESSFLTEQIIVYLKDN